MKVIGLTGGIGSGKSTVARFLVELGAVVLDADKIGHELLLSGGEAWQRVVNAFGKQVVASNGDIDRQKLGQKVFVDSEARIRLNRIMHPVISYRVKAQLQEYRQKRASVVVIEAPLLLEAGWKSEVDEVWVTAASENTILKRLVERSGLTEQAARARIGAQLPSDIRIQQADIVIDTDCGLDELKARAKKLWEGLQGQNN